ncbi:MAG: 6-phosphofructokinase [Saprospiraceae bacterium]|jgi:6-phosphofructokinase 1
MKNIAVFTSGGDAPGMNACIRAVVRSALHFDLEVYGIMRGYQGMIEDDFIPLKRESVSNIIQMGGTILRSARSALFRTPEGRYRAYENLCRRNIDCIVAIGGDGTFTGAKVFMEEYPDIRIVGCPGTIDNDLYGTDYTIGFDTAINTAMEAIDKIKDTANAHDRLFFIEVMGRDAGFIAMATAIATGAEAVLVPEMPTDIEKLIETLTKGWQKKKTSSIVIVAEGEEAGGAFQVAELVKEKMRAYEIKVSVLGHIQRGGHPSCMDRLRASRIGVAAVQALIDGEKGVMAGIIHDKICFTPFEQAIKHNQEINPRILQMVDILS